MKPSALKEITK